jgi:hypothetical protein
MGPRRSDTRPEFWDSPTSPWCHNLWLVEITNTKRRTIRAQLTCGVATAPLFVTAFTVIGAKRPGYDWRRDPVSALSIGKRGWPQRANFGLTGVLYLLGAMGLLQSPRRDVGPRAVPALVATAGIGLIGSGLFVADPVGDFPPVTADEEGPKSSVPPESVRTRAGKLHNLFAIPIFAGLPVAALVTAAGAARSGNVRWAGYSACSSLATIASFLAFGAAFGAAFGRGSILAGEGGVFQRISIASGFAWVTVLSFRARSSLRDS